MRKSKANPVLSILEDQINERVRFGMLLIELKTLGAKLGLNVQLGVGSKKTRKPAKKTAKKYRKVAPKRKLSAAARKRIAAAQKARWAKFHAKQKKTPKKAA